MGKWLGDLYLGVRSVWDQEERCAESAGRGGRMM